jgi:hypothetical protein
LANVDLVIAEYSAIVNSVLCPRPFLGDHEDTKITMIIQKMAFFVAIVSFRLRQGYGETSPKLEERRRVVTIVMMS